MKRLIKAENINVYDKVDISPISENTDDMEDMIISFQLIILEYLLTRYSAFLNYCINDEKIQREEIKNNIITFSRVIENNKDAVIEFLNDGFEEIILEIGYLCFISLV